jgi:hypothetical protein
MIKNMPTISSSYPPNLMLLPSTSTAFTSSSGPSSLVHHHQQFTECTQAYFNRAKFFFNPPQIRQQMQMDRRFLQRLNREAAHANVESFFPIGLSRLSLSSTKLIARL